MAPCGFDSEPEEDDWPKGALGSSLCQIEKTLTCDICKDFLTNPQSLPCLHNFCFDCLTRCFDSALNGKINAATLKNCPVCRKKCEPHDARPNHALSLVVQSFKATRKELLTTLHKPPPASVVVAVAPEAVSSARKRGRPRRAAMKNYARDESEEEEVEAVTTDNEDYHETTTKTETSSSSSSSASNDNSRSRGVPITAKVTKAIFTGKETSAAVKKLIIKLGAGCSYNVRNQLNSSLPASTGELKNKYRLLVIAINSQVDAGESALTLDEVIAKFVGEARVAAKAQAIDNSHKAYIEKLTGKDEGFQNLIRAEKKRKLEARSDTDHQQQPEESTNYQNQAHGASAHGSPKEVTTASTKKCHHDNIDIDIDGAQIDASSWQSNWKVMHSAKFNRPFFFNRKTNIGTYEKPHEVPDEAFLARYASNASNTTTINMQVESPKDCSKFVEPTEPQDSVTLDLTSTTTTTTTTTATTAAAAAADGDDGYLVSNSSTPEMWHCPACTFNNTTSLDKCAMCMTSNPSLARKKTRSGGRLSQSTLSIHTGMQNSSKLRKTIR